MPKAVDKVIPQKEIDRFAKDLERLTKELSLSDRRHYEKLSSFAKKWESDIWEALTRPKTEFETIAPEELKRLFYGKTCIDNFSETIDLLFDNKIFRYDDVTDEVEKKKRRQRYICWLLDKICVADRNQLRSGLFELDVVRWLAGQAGARLTVLDWGDDNSDKKTDLAILDCASIELKALAGSSYQSAMDNIRKADEQHQAAKIQHGFKNLGVTCVRLYFDGFQNTEAMLSIIEDTCEDLESHWRRGELRHTGIVIFFVEGFIDKGTFYERNLHITQFAKDQSTRLAIAQCLTLPENAWISRTNNRSAHSSGASRRSICCRVWDLLGAMGWTKQLRSWWRRVESWRRGMRCHPHS